MPSVPSPRKSHSSEATPTLSHLSEASSSPEPLRKPVAAGAAPVAEASKLDTIADLHGLVGDLSIKPARPDDVVIPAQVAPVPKLSELEQRVLAFERKWWRHAGSKEQAIREQFDLSATRYYQLLNKLLDLPEALEFDPIVVGRLRRLRASRARARSSR
jgi:Protein of unknown function (DUF3263)